MMRSAGPVHITFAAYGEFRKFLESHPEILARETREAHVDPLTDPDAYFDRELLESNHADVRLMVELHDGIVGRGAIARWIPEEEQEPEHQIQYPGRHETSVCPTCGRIKEATGHYPFPVCRFCEPVKATMRA
ncbi:MAG: hypothetical protein ACREB9_08955, partial [Thermoplasmata archaeon]